MLGEFAQLVLLAILRCPDGAHALALREVLAERAGRKVGRSALYTTLDRLEERGLVRWRVGDSTPERGGIPRREFELTSAGLEEIRRARQTWSRMEAGLDDVLHSEDAG